MTQERTRELLDLLINNMVEEHGLDAREVLEELIELGFQKDELIELQFPEDDVNDLMEECPSREDDADDNTDDDDRPEE
jgi:hypothetical protein